MAVNVPSRESLVGKKVKDLKHLLREAGLPLSGKKEELIERLTNPNYRGKKPKKWEHSEAKKCLRRMLLDPTSSIHSMSVIDAQRSDPRFLKYPMFNKYYADLKRAIAAEKMLAKEDDAKALKHIRNNKRSEPRRGYPSWHDHAAKELLEDDVFRNLHEQMPPRELWKTRPEYMEFPKDVFRSHINNEANKQRSAKYWAYKRNIHGMKRYLEDLERRSNKNRT